MQYSPSQAFTILYDHYCTQILHFLQQSGRQFGLLCDESKVHFDPPQAKSQATRHGRMLEFMISGSTFDSLEIQQDSLGQVFVHFVVGLTPGASGERVVVRIRGVYQIFIKDTLNEECALFTRVDSSLIFSASESKPKQNPPSELGEGFSKKERQSLQAISKNTHNRKVLAQLIGLGQE